MNELEMTLAGSDVDGWQWAVTLDGETLERTPRLATEDLGEGLASIQQYPDRRNAHFDHVRDERLGILLAGFFAGDFAHALDTSAEEQVWAKHMISPSLPTELGGSFMFLVESTTTDADRLLHVDGVKVRSYRVPRGRFDALLRDIRARLEIPATT
jgi:hypothetical protein